MAELERFKEDADCRVLLATVASGGTGLNITEANHVLFLDRWFNPFVYAQAMDRCHRIGQKKLVKIEFIDANMTGAPLRLDANTPPICAIIDPMGSGDQVMCWLNTMKEQNSNIVLADGTGYYSARCACADYRLFGRILFPECMPLAVRTL